MNSNYIIPVSVAAAVHAAVLFGFTKSPRVRISPDIETTQIIVFPLPPLDVFELPESSGEKSKEAASIEPPPAVLPEPVAVFVDVPFTLTSPVIDVSILREDTKIIPNTFGPDGGSDGRPGFGPIISAMLDNSPRTRFQAAPQYPFSAKTTGLSGEVLVEFIVDESGRVLDPRVVRSTDRVFEEPTLRAVAKWQFEPGRSGGRIVRFRMAVPVVFNLNDGG
ncbi:MAG: energy transducer TonB [Opitutaceae bacterium]